MSGHRDVYSKVKADPPLAEQLQNLEVDKDKLKAEDNLIRETHHIRSEFHVLFTKIHWFLMNKGVTVKDFVSFLKKVPGYGRKSLLDNNMILKLSEAPDLIDVFDTVSDHCSWFNHSLLGLIIDVYCNDNREVKKACKDYCTHLQRYCKHRVKKCPLLNGFGHGGEEDKELIMKVDKEWEEIRIEQLEEVLFDISGILKISRHTLHLCSVENGCVQLTFLVPNHIPAALFPLSTEQEVAMMKMGVFDLKCGSYHFACQVNTVCVLCAHNVSRSLFMLVFGAITITLFVIYNYGTLNQLPRNLKVWMLRLNWTFLVLKVNTVVSHYLQAFN